MKYRSKILSLLIVFLFVFSTFLTGTVTTVRADTVDDGRKVKEINNKYLEQEKQLKASEEVTLIVQLNEKAAKDYDLALTLEEAANNSKFVDKALNSQKSYREKILNIDKNANFDREFCILLNGFAVKTKYENADKIKNIQGVKNVTLANVYTPRMSSAKEVTNVKQVWEKYKYKGEGMVIAIIDTGVDYTHKDMRISDGVKVKLTEKDIKKISGKGKYFTKKIPYGYNYADDNYDIIERTNTTDNYSHGMHVAGIAAANGLDEEVEKGEAIKGTAPEAQILALKVFTNNGFSQAYDQDVIAAIEDAVAHGADVINMSLGDVAGFKDSNNPFITAVREASKRGVICVTAAGNDMYATQPYKFGNLPDSGDVDSPAVADEALAVASCTNNGVFTETVKYCTGDKTGSSPYTFVNNPVDVLDGEYEVVDCGIGRMPGDSQDNPEANDFQSKALAGKIALIKRGELNFSLKSLNAQKQGAVGVIIYNHENGGDALTGMAGFGEENKIPTVFIWNSAGEKIKKLIAEEVKVKFDGIKELVDNPMKGDMSDFSSWGPTPSLELKPEVAAPGSDIYSTVKNDKYSLSDGTSMATPHTAGVMALIMQHMKGLNVEFENDLDKIKFAKIMVMNTAQVRLDPVTENQVPFSPRRMGAGFVDAEAAVENFVTVTDSLNKKAAVELGEIDSNKVSFELTLTNYGDNDTSYKIVDRSGVLTEQEEEFIDTISYDVKVKNAKIVFDKEKITIPAGESAKIKTTITLPKDLTTERFIEGFIGFECEEEGIPSIGIPYIGFYGEWDKPIITDLPAWNENSVWGETFLKNVDSMENDEILGMSKVDEYGNPVIDSELIAIDGENDNVVPQVTFFRNAKKLYVNVLDENHEVVRVLSIMDNFKKNVFDKSDDEKDTFDKLNWGWDGKLYNVENGKYEIAPQGQYYFEIKAKIDYRGAKQQKLELPIKIDKANPQIYDINTANGKLTFKAKDDFSGIKAFAVRVNHQLYEDKEGNTILNLKADKNGRYSVDIGLVEKDKLAIYAIDNAENVGMYRNEIPAPLDIFNVVIDGFSNRSNNEEGVYLTSNKVKVNGYVTSKVKLLKIMDKLVKVNEDLSFETEIELPKQGLNKIKVYAESKDKQICDYAFSVFCDSKAPVINLSVPNSKKDEIIVHVDDSCKNYRIKGNVKDNLFGYKLFINGTQVENVDLYNNTPLDTLRKFSRNIEIKGIVNIIELKAIDQFGNESVKKVVVIKD